jgi:signal transduction histidine kinase
LKQRDERFSMAVRGLQAAAVNCLIALALTLWGRMPFGTNFLYSQLIGLSIWALIDFGRLWLVDDWETQWVRLVLLVPVGVAGGYVLGTLAGDALLGRPLLEHWLATPRHALGMLAMSLVAGAVVTYYFLSRERLASLRQRELAARSLASESRLKLLEAQLEPHMLFNTLANLRALIGVDAARSQQMLDHLIAYLRATLRASRATTHPLGAEFDRVRDYLALMSVRMGPRLAFTLHLPRELAAEPVPTLLLQPLVENSVLHGLEGKVEGGRVDVAARRDGADLVLEVVDTGIGLGAPGAQEGEGFGLAQTRERLATLYGAAATVRLAAEAAGGVRATVRFPART